MKVATRKENSMSNILSISLGVMIFLFGVLKFDDPFGTWYSVQIQTSGLPEFSYYLGIVGEIVVGIGLILSYFMKNEKWKRGLSSVGSLSLFVMMVVAIYVHLLPAVPAEVLPLKIKMPVIPAVVLVAAAMNFYLSIAPRTSFLKIRS